jgi:hypothetical protein
LDGRIRFDHDHGRQILIAVSHGDRFGAFAAVF